jgi:hypothetical protein
METNKNKNNENTETESNMGFTLSKHLNDQVVKLLPEIWDSEEALVVPESEGQVLVREGSKACLERQNDPKIVMIPLKVDAIRDGKKEELVLFLCTK